MDGERIFRRKKEGELQTQCLLSAIQLSMKEYICGILKYGEFNTLV